MDILKVLQVVDIHNTYIDKTDEEQNNAFKMC